MTNVFADYHHGGLTKSLEFLFEKRLGYSLYRPVGLEWFPKRWKIAAPYDDDIRTATQYLSLRGNEPVGDHYEFDGMKGLSLEQFKAMDIDIVIASIPDHLPVYRKLIDDFHPKAKLIFQMGNEFSVDFSLAKNILSSTAKFDVPSDVNAVFYHQEFDLKEFSYTPPKESNLVRSFVHCLGQGENHFAKDWTDFKTLEKALPELKFESYGSLCRDGIVSKGMAERIRECKLGVMFKDGGDGFGHAIHQWFAMGRPPIVKKSQYKGKLAEELMTKDTCIDFDEGVEKCVERLKMSQEEYLKMCNNAHKIFIEKVDFDKEAETIRQFLDRLV